MSNLSVKWFNETHSGVPTLNGSVHSLNNLLKACLVTGFGSVTLNSLVVSSGMATGTVSTGHGFAMHGSGVVGPIILIEGSSTTALNGEWRLYDIPSSTQFRFSCPGIPDVSAGGTITAKRAPAGWETLFDDNAGKTVFRSTDPFSTQACLRINTTAGANYQLWDGYVSMSDIDAGTEKINSVQLYSKSYTSGSTPWDLIADGSAFYLLVPWHSTYYPNASGNFFGDIVSYRLAGDPYRAAMIGAVTQSAPYPGGNLTTGQDDFKMLGISSGIVGRYIARDYTLATPASNTFYNLSAFNSSASGYEGFGRTYNGLAYPDPMNSGIFGHEVLIREGYNMMLRGKMPGCYNPHVSAASVSAHRVVLAATALNGGRNLVLLTLGSGTTVNYSKVLFDIIGPWR